MENLNNTNKTSENAEKEFIVYQLSKLNGHYRWTGTKWTDKLPKESIDYLWVDSKEEAERLTNTPLSLNHN